MGQEEVLKIIERELITNTREIHTMLELEERSIRRAISKMIMFEDLIFKVRIGRKQFYVKNGIYSYLFKDEGQNRKKDADAGESHNKEWCFLNNLQ